MGARRRGLVALVVVSLLAKAVSARSFHHDEESESPQLASAEETLSFRREVQVQRQNPKPQKGSSMFARNLDNDPLFQGDPALVWCYNNMQRADENMDNRLTQEEYVEFLRLQSHQRVDSPVFYMLDVMFVATYFSAACVRCYQTTPGQNCCVGNREYLFMEPNDRESLEATVTFTCNRVNQRMNVLFDPIPAPTNSPTIPQSPSDAPMSPSGSPTPVDAIEPQTAMPTDQQTGSPTRGPSISPTIPEPTVLPTETPTDAPTDPPSTQPTSNAPTSSPMTASPTSGPSISPSVSEPTTSPSASPTGSPTTAPSTQSLTTNSPTSAPLAAQTNTPSKSPSVVEPTSSPEEKTSNLPTASPTTLPTASPSTRSLTTSSPTLAPSAANPDTPTKSPSGSKPTTSPEEMTSGAPTASPSTQSLTTNNPTLAPSAAHTKTPTTSPEEMTTVAPTVSPTATPSTQSLGAPSTSPVSVTSAPTSRPSAAHSGAPSRSPSVSPTGTPTGAPSTRSEGSPSSSPVLTTPASDPTLGPSLHPTRSPTISPTGTPTVTPSYLGVPSSSPVLTSPTPSDPTSGPSTHSTRSPTVLPTGMPTATPLARSPGAPSSSPVLTTPTANDPTSAPSAHPTRSPTVSPTRAPTARPSTRSPSVPSSSPSLQPNVALTSVSTNVQDIRVVLEMESPGTVQLDDSAVATFEQEYVAMNNKFYQGAKRRHLLRALGVKDDVTLVSTTFEFKSEKILSNGADIEITYDQAITFNKPIASALEAPDVILGPFLDDSTRETLQDAIRNSHESFTNLVSISIPIMPSQSRSSPSNQGVASLGVIGKDDSGGGEDSSLFFVAIVASLAGLLAIVATVGVRRSKRGKKRARDKSGNNYWGFPSEFSVDESSGTNLAPAGQRYEEMDEERYDKLEQMEQLETKTVTTGSLSWFLGTTSLVGGEASSVSEIATTDTVRSPAAGSKAAEIAELKEWEEAKDPFGRTYFYNPETGEVTWDRPKQHKEKPSNDAEEAESQTECVKYQEQTVEFMAPPGSLGVVIDSSSTGDFPVVIAVKDSSIIASKIQCGDKLKMIDGVDVSGMTAAEASEVIRGRSRSRERKFTVVRTFKVEEDLKSEAENSWLFQLLEHDHMVSDLDLEHMSLGSSGIISIKSSESPMLREISGHISEPSTHSIEQPKATQHAVIDDSSSTAVSVVPQQLEKREETIEFIAPPGKLGLVVDTSEKTLRPIILAVKPWSIISHLVEVEDEIVKIDETDVSSLNAIQVSEIISEKSENLERRFTIVRRMYEVQSFPPPPDVPSAEEMERERSFFEASEPSQSPSMSFFEASERSQSLSSLNASHGHTDDSEPAEKVQTMQFSDTENTQESHGDYQPARIPLDDDSSKPSRVSAVPRQLERREETIEVVAPSGKLGLVVDTSETTFRPIVLAVKPWSIISHLIKVGDEIIKIDETDLSSLGAIQVSEIISEKSTNPERRFTVVRTVNQVQLVPSPAANVSRAEENERGLDLIEANALSSISSLNAFHELTDDSESVEEIETIQFFDNENIQTTHEDY